MALAALLAPVATRYARRIPERTARFEAIRRHLATFRATCDPPAFVSRAFQRFLDCGVLAKGFVRVRCAECRQEQLVAFSCKDLREASDADDSAQPGTVTFLQHFGSTLNLHVHFHLLALDGLYESHGDQAPLSFVRAPTPTVEELQRLVERTERRIRALVAQRPPASEPAEAQAPLLRVFGAEPSEPSEPKLVAQFDGFNRHAGTSFDVVDYAR